MRSGCDVKLSKPKKRRRRLQREAVRKSIIAGGALKSALGISHEIRDSQSVSCDVDNACQFPGVHVLEQTLVVIQAMMQDLHWHFIGHRCFSYASGHSFPSGSVPQPGFHGQGADAVLKTSLNSSAPVFSPTAHFQDDSLCASPVIPTAQISCSGCWQVLPQSCYCGALHLCSACAAGVQGVPSRDDVRRGTKSWSNSRAPASILAGKSPETRISTPQQAAADVVAGYWSDGSVGDREGSLRGSSAALSSMDDDSEQQDDDEESDSNDDNSSEALAVRRAFLVSVSSGDFLQASSYSAGVWSADDILNWTSATLDLALLTNDRTSASKTVWREWAVISHHLPTALAEGIVNKLDSKLKSHGYHCLQELVS